MANWCRYCEGSYPKYLCKVTNQYIPWSIVERSCMNNGYKCSDYWISTYVGVILRIKDNDKTLKNIEKLKNDLERDENYSNYIKMYNAMGPILADRLNYDNECLSWKRWTRVYR